MHATSLFLLLLAAAGALSMVLVYRSGREARTLHKENGFPNCHK